MTTPPLYVGPASPELCAAAAEACAAAKVAKQPLKDVASTMGVSRSTLRRLVLAHAAMQQYAVTLERHDFAAMTVCTVVTPKGAQAAAVAAYRAYPGTLKALELPGWQLRVGKHASFDLSAVRNACGGA